MIREHFDVVVVGSGFGSLFFVEGLLQKRPEARVLMLERGTFNSHSWQLQNNKNSPLHHGSTFRTDEANKEWKFTVGLGGGTNCWYGQTPRFHPSDFKMRSQYGVAQDWPLDYAELEPYYVAAENRMSVAGAPEMSDIMPRSAPFPLPPHKLTTVDKIMRKAQPEYHFPIATARASRATGSRPPCCGSARCNLCPVDAKFTFENGFAHLRDLPNVEIRLECDVSQFDTAAGVAQAAVYRKDGVEHRVTGDLFVLGANAIHSPAILLRSGIDRPLTGVGIHEQVGYTVEVLLDGVDGVDGGTITTALNFSLYDGAFRKDYGGALIYFDNRWPYGLRTEYGRWRQIAPLVVVVEDLPQSGNRVTLDSDGLPLVTHPSVSDYAKRGVEKSLAKLDQVLKPLPVERIDFKRMRETESHIQGSLRMGSDPATSVVDARQLHHDVRNLVVVGSSVFPSGPNCNPSLSVAALSLRSAALIV
jgi:choline dehydrogenase-like flavoprotein